MPDLDISALSGLLSEAPDQLTSSDKALLDHYAWLAFDEVTRLLAVAHAGDHGLTGNQARALTKNSELGWLRLETCSLVKWERDLRGRLAYLVLTPKGDDFADALVKASRPGSGYTWKTSDSEKDQ